MAAPLLGPRATRASRPLYGAFMTAHAVHFAAVTGYAVMTGGRDLFPGGRSLHDVGGWPTVFGIYTLFGGLAATGWAGGADRPAGREGTRSSAAGAAAKTIIGAMFVGTYLGQVRRSRWYAAPAGIVAAATIAGTKRNVMRPGRSGRRR